jgi:glycosyltransferase involved in cell wall biosynthesis
VRKKIIITATTFPLSESDSQPRFVLDLASQLAKNFDVSVLVPHYPKATQSTEYGNVKVIRYRYFLERFEKLTYGSGILENLKNQKWLVLLIPFLVIGQFFALYQQVVKQKIQVVNAHWILPQGLVAIILKKLFKLKNVEFKVVLTSHGGDLFALNSWFLKSLKRWVIKNADVTLVVSEAMRDFCYQSLKVPQSCPIEVRSMGVDLQSTFVMKNPQTQRDGVIFVGRIAEKKGLHILVKAMDIVKQQYPSVHLTVVGDGSEKQYNQQLTKTLGLEGHISFTGALKHSEIPELLNQAKIFAMPSKISKSGDQEGLGLVAVEAMGCGCAVVAAELAAIKDVVKHNKTGLMFKPEDPACLAQAIITLLSDDKKRQSLAIDGNQFANKNFNWQLVAEKYIDCFNRI